MSSAYSRDVYAQLLSLRGHGLPLWEPEPTRFGEVLIGDVGYMQNGGFFRLFNSILPAEDPVNLGGVPQDYKQLQIPDTLRHHTRHALGAGAICSKGVAAVNVDASAEVGIGTPLNPLGGIHFKSSEQQGAVLVLKRGADREMLHDSHTVNTYILQNHDSWCRFARDVRQLDLKPEDIMFVSGWIKTGPGEWALAATADRGQDTGITLGGSFGQGIMRASFSFSTPWEHRHGPEGVQEDSEGAKYDQCVFLNYIKLKRRPLFPLKRLRAAAEPRDLSRSSTRDGLDDMIMGDAQALESDEDCTLVEMVPQPSEQGDMVDVMLDYILEQTSATCAIASDRDVPTLLNSQNQGDIPENLHQFLTNIRPILIVIDGVGMLSGSNAQER
ncbi:hypothetical protein GSI_07832 [Ganoderma sinense ZZ0214-1]|uniref:Uncharacterized protein n=1 Tax=Ganoderma sinense ZZ0214-1 TaxID=1077348 RepID=A0A2G8S811_9APHY|nr:hypothetical protein GSI_07832 [Ganoderma sinense ZZ0214-1]